MRTETIAVKGRDEPVTIEVVVTRHGPIVEGDPRQPAAEKFELSPARPIAGIGVAGTTAAESRVALAACLTGTDERGSKWMDTVLDVLLAKDADGIEAAVNEWTEPVVNSDTFSICVLSVSLNPKVSLFQSTIPRRRTGAPHGCPSA